MSPDMRDSFLARDQCLTCVSRQRVSEKESNRSEKTIASGESNFVVLQALPEQ